MKSHSKQEEDFLEDDISRISSQIQILQSTAISSNTEPFNTRITAENLRILYNYVGEEEKNKSLLEAIRYSFHLDEFNNLSSISSPDNTLHNLIGLLSDTNELKSLLFLLKLLLCYLDLENQLKMKMQLWKGETETDFGQSFDSLHALKLLGKRDFKYMLDYVIQSELIKSFSGCQRILPYYLRPEKLLHLDIHGASTGILTGIKIQRNSGIFYYEVIIKGDGSNCRIGWNRRGSIPPKMIGNDYNSWAIDIKNKIFYHNASEIMAIAQRLTNDNNIDVTTDMPKSDPNVKTGPIKDDDKFDISKLEGEINRINLAMAESKEEGVLEAKMNADKGTDDKMSSSDNQSPDHVSGGDNRTEQSEMRFHDAISAIYSGSNPLEDEFRRRFVARSIRNPFLPLRETSDNATSSTSTSTSTITSESESSSSSMRYPINDIEARLVLRRLRKLGVTDGMTPSELEAQGLTQALIEDLILSQSSSGPLLCFLLQINFY